MADYSHSRRSLSQTVGVIQENSRREIASRFLTRGISPVVWCDEGKEPGSCVGTGAQNANSKAQITTTNFVLDIGVAGAVVPWIAIGAP